LAQLTQDKAETLKAMSNNELINLLTGPTEELAQWGFSSFVHHISHAVSHVVHRVENSVESAVHKAAHIASSEVNAIKSGAGDLFKAAKNLGAGIARQAVAIAKKFGGAALAKAKWLIKQFGKIRQFANKIAHINWVKVAKTASKALFVAFWWLHKNCPTIMTYEPIAADVLMVFEPEWIPVIMTIKRISKVTCTIVQKVAANKSIFPMLCLMAYKKGYVPKNVLIPILRSAGLI
jgi:hypothetical protein